ncbi:hypothetical protein ACFQ4L_10325 [Lapidilactobacillus mulanensis]|uniref:AP2 domain-containing protein n=1 Tax=Lapidilactobacillus mulanensis TaxID=2485999 RepID=A0ABW4DRT8_9LACO|nr:hypothetical protein [Lapidilactobacillus mulanensis]
MKKRKFNITVGTSVGKITVLEIIGNRITDQKYRCHCDDCGRDDFVVSRATLRWRIKYNSKAGCGCIPTRPRREEMPPPRDLTNKKFGELTVKKLLKKDGYRSIYLCECSCTKTKNVSYQLLVNGKTRSCGHLAKQSNSKYGKLAGDLLSSKVDGVSVRQIAQMYSVQQKNNTSGAKGVAVYKRKDGTVRCYRAYIKVNGKQISHSGFATVEEASLERKRLEEEYFEPTLEKVKDRKITKNIDRRVNEYLGR